MIVRRNGMSRVARAGAHLVEFALVIPLFFLFLFAMIEIGRAMMVSSLVTNAARAGSRTGIIPGKNTSDVVATVDGMLASQGISGYTTTVTVNGSAGIDVSAAKTSDSVAVSVSVPMSKASWLPGLSYINANINGQFSMPHE